MLFPDDELVLCLFEAPSQAAVKQASEEVGIPCERVMTTVWLGQRR
jgi:8-oxo-dGTP pyrophosphatase MutT (NUDIX family)